VSDTGGREVQENDGHRPVDWRDESGIVVFGGGGGRRGGCSATGCLMWIVISVAMSVGLTILLNLIFLLFSAPAPGIPGIDT
jgi:hypothetical protein